MARWGFIGVRRRAAAVVALTAAIAGLTGLQAAGSTLDDPPVPPSPPQITVTSNGVEIVDCIGQPVCPDSVAAGEPVVVTIRATSPGVVAQRYRFDSVTTDVPGSDVTVTLTPERQDSVTLNVQSINEFEQLSTTAYFRFNVGPRPAPVGTWNFDDGTGSTAADGAVPAHPLTLGNGAAFDGKGRINGSVALDGVNDFAQATDAVVDTSKSFSVSAWARPTSATKTGVVAAATGTNSSAFGLYYDASSKRWVFARSSADVKNPTLYRASSTEAPVNGAWTHLIGTYDAATAKLQLFVNGRLQQTATSATGWKAAGPLMVGRARFGGALTGQFAGSLDQINVWQRVVVANEFPALVDPRFGPSGNDQAASAVAAYWPLDNAVHGGGVWRTADAVRGADLTVTGFGAASNQSGAFVDDEERGRVLELTGRSREAVTLNRSVVDGSASFTVAAWVKFGDLSKPMVIARQGTAGKDTWRLEYRPVDEFTSELIFARADAASAAETVATMTVDREQLSGWHVIGGQYDRTAFSSSPEGQLRVSLDNRSGSGGTLTLQGTPTRAGTTVVGTARTAGKSFIGRLDDLRVYAGFTSQTRICEDYPNPDFCGS